MSETAEQYAVEIHPWVDASPTSYLVSNFARVHILVSLFDGDPDKWIRFILRNGTSVEQQHDLPFVQELKRRLSSEPMLMEKLRRIVNEFSAIIST